LQQELQQVGTNTYGRLSGPPVVGRQQQILRI
jgi:hypothetical protein